MKKLIQFCGVALATLFLCGQQKINAVTNGPIAVDTSLTIPPYATTTTFRTDGYNWASAEVVVTSATVSQLANQTFTDGAQATATFTVGAYLGLSSATASGKITINTNSAAARQCVSGGGPTLGSFNVCNPAQWVADVNSSTQTACNIAAAIQATNVILSTCNFGSASAGIVFTSAPYYGAQWNNNNFVIATSSQPAFTLLNFVSSNPVTAVALGGMLGGQNNQTFSINGVTLTANKDYFPLTSNVVTAINIQAAINANASLNTIVVATATNNAAAVVYATATVNGVAGDFAIFTSSQNDLTIAPFTSSGTSATGNMVGGVNPSYSLNSASITIAGNVFQLGQPTVYQLGAGGQVIAGLTAGTTYFSIPQATPSGTLMLASTLANALAGVGIPLTSSTSKTTQDTYNLFTPNTSGVTSLTWVVSDDAVHWATLTTTPFNVTITPNPASYTTYVATGSVNIYDFGRMDYGYLGATILPPATQGIANWTIRLIGKAQ